jgi:hypothetical protein
MNEFDLSAEGVAREAERQIKEENYRKAVEAAKSKLLSKRSVWQKLFPFTITITRRK